MVISTSLYSHFVPNIVEINSLGIGLASSSNVDQLDLTSSEYLVVGERHNETNNTLDSKYNLIVNSDGIAVNATRRMFNTITSNNRLDSNIYQNAGFYITNDIRCEGKVIARGLELHGVTLADEVNTTVLNELIQNINAQDPLFYKGYNDFLSNNIGQLIQRENIYTTSYVTIGSLADTFSNSHPLNITETANNSIENIQIAIQNDINNDCEPAKFRLGLIGDSPFSPAILSTTAGMPLEFHVGKTTRQMDDLYIDGTGFPDYTYESNHLPDFVIDARGNVGIGTTETENLHFNNYNRVSYYNIIQQPKQEYSKLKVDGSAYIKNIITYDYYNKSNLHLDDIYVRTHGLSIEAGQIKSGNFNKGEFKFNSNVYIGYSNNDYKLEVNSILDVKGNLLVSDRATINNINIEGVADFNHDTRFAEDVIIGNDLYLSNCMHITNGDIFYGGKRLNVSELQPVFINVPKIDISIPSIATFFPDSYNDYLTSNISAYILHYVNQNGIINITEDIRGYINTATNNYLDTNISNLVVLSINDNINSNYIAEINNYIDDYMINSYILSNSVYYISNYVHSYDSLYHTEIIPNILSNISTESNLYGYLYDYIINKTVPLNGLIFDITNNINYDITYFTSNYLISECNIISNISFYITSNAPESSIFIDEIINDIYNSNNIYYPEFISYFEALGTSCNVSSNIFSYIESQNVSNLVVEYSNYIKFEIPELNITAGYLFNLYNYNTIVYPDYLLFDSSSNIYSNIISYGTSNTVVEIDNYISDITNITSNTVIEIYNDIYTSNDIYNIARYIPTNIEDNISNIVLNSFNNNGSNSIINSVKVYVYDLLALSDTTVYETIYDIYTSNVINFSNLLPLYPFEISSNISGYIANNYNNSDAIIIGSNIDEYISLSTYLEPSTVNDILLNTIFDIYVKNNNPSVNDVDLSVLHGLNLTNSNIVYFANNHTLNISGSNLAVPGRLGVGILENDCYDQQMTINKRNEYSFELMLQDYSKNTPDGSKVYIGHTKGFEDQYYGSINQVEDSSFMICTQRNVQWHNIYFFPGKDINRTYGIQNQIPTLAIMQNDKVGINTNRPVKELEVIGDILCNDLYVKRNNNIHKTAQFIYNNDNVSKIIYLYDATVQNVCVNFFDKTGVDLKGLNVANGINSLDGYYDNNQKIETLKYHEDNSVYINKNVSIGWDGELNNKAPLQVRNLSIDDNNYSVIRVYRGQRGGGFNNDALYSGLDICEYCPVLPIQDRDNYRWFMYKYNIDNPQQNRVGPLQFGYVDGFYEPRTFGLTMYYNKNGTYHLDVNNDEVNYNYDEDTAMTIHGDLNVHGNINIIDNNKLGFNYRINGIAVSSNIAGTLLNSNLLNPSYDDFILSKDDIAINGEKIVILPNKATAIGYVDNWFLQYVQRLETDTNEKTPLVIYQKNTDKPICKFEAIDSGVPNKASIELGVFYTQKNYNGENKNMAEFKVLGYNDTTILEINSFSTFNQSLRPFITFYNNGLKNYTNIGSYTAYDSANGVPIVEDVCFHINDDAPYLLQLTNHGKTPRINMHKIGGSYNDYWLLTGPDDYNNFGITYGHSSAITYSPTSLNQILTITNNGLIGVNNTKPVETLDISSAFNRSSTKLTNKYNSEDLYQKTSTITVPNSNLKITYDIPFVYATSNNNYYSGFDYTIDTSNLPTLDNSNITIFNYFLVDTTLNVSNTFPATTYHEVNALMYHSNLHIHESNMYIFAITNDYGVSTSNYSIDLVKNINILPELRLYDEFQLFVPEVFIHRESLYELSNVYEINITPEHTITYNYSNIYTLPNILAPEYIDIINTITSTCNIIETSNIYVYNTINTLIPLSINTIYTNYNILLDDIFYETDNGYSNYIITSNIIWFNEESIFNLGVGTYRTIDYTFNSTLKVPDLLVGSLIHTLPSPTINGSNIDIISTIDFLNPTPNAPIAVDFTSYLTRTVVNTCNIIDNFEIYDIPQETIINIEDAYYLYDFRDYIRDLYLNIECVQYLPHIILQNYIQFDDTTAYPIDNIHKLFSYEGKLDIYLDKEGNSDKLLSIDENGDTTIKGSITTQNLHIEGHIYDRNGNDLVQHINSDVYTINTENYQVTSSNIIFNPVGSYGILINGQERNYTNNIFQINHGYKDNDANFITLNSYTNGSFIHFTSHTKTSYNDYTDYMYRFGMYNNSFGIWKYDLDDVRTLPGGYVDGKSSSMINYTQAMNIVWNNSTNVFDFDFNGSINLDESSNSYLRLGNTLLQNSTIKQINNTNDIMSFTNYLDEEILTITSNNVGIVNTTPDVDYKLHVGGSLKINNDIRCDGNVISASDKRFKTNIQKIENSLDKIDQLSGITYDNILLDNRRQTGLIAQEVEKILPEAVVKGTDGYLSLSYGNMMGLIVESIKDLRKEIKELKDYIYN